jgi:hypothetical protein
MKNIRYIIYVNNDMLYLKDRKTTKIFKEKFISIKNNEIIDYQKFLFEISKFIKQNHIKISIFGYKLIFIKNNNLSKLQVKTYKNVLDNYFKKISFIDVNSILNINKKIVIANITEHYIDFYYSKELIRINKILYLREEEIFKYFIDNIYNPQKFIIIGNDKNIKTICDTLSKNLKTNTYYTENYETYIIDLIEKKHK